MLTHQAKGNCAASPQNHTRAYQKHGAYTKRRQVKQRGNKPIDGRSCEAHFRNALAEERGGIGSLPLLARERIDLAATTRALVNRIDTYLLREGGDVVNKRARKLHAVVRERMGMVETLLRIYGLIDGKAGAPDNGGPDLQDYLKGKGGADGR